MDPKIKNRVKPEDKKSKFVQARLTEQEYQTVSLLAENSNRKISDIVRQSITRVRPWTIENKKIEQEKIFQIAKIGNNLNQISRWCNRYKSAAETFAIVSHLVAIEHEIKKIMG